MATKSIIERVSTVLKAYENLGIQYDPPADGPRSGSFVPVSESTLHCGLQDLLNREAPSGLFTHQHAAIESVISGQHTIAATRTSSGKSLIFSLPSLNALVGDKQATALFLYPQKALANDQLAKLRRQFELVPELASLQAAKPHLISRYDGGIAADDRKAIRDQVQLLLTNPDMVHLGILQHHQTGWARFFANLQIVAIDECHEYRGIFGTNVAYGGSLYDMLTDEGFCTSRRRVPETWEIGKLTFTSIESLARISSNELTDSIGAIFLLDPTCMVYRGRTMQLGNGRIHDRPQFVANFIGDCENAGESPLFIIMTSKRAAAIPTESVARAYCLETLWFLDGPTMR